MQYIYKIKHNIYYIYYNFVKKIIIYTIILSKKRLQLVFNFFLID